MKYQLVVIFDSCELNPESLGKEWGWGGKKSTQSSHGSSMSFTRHRALGSYSE